MNSSTSNGNQVEIRPMQPGDIPALAAIARKIQAADGFLPEGWPSSEILKACLARAPGKKMATAYFTLTRASRAIGGMCGIWGASPSDLSVHPWAALDAGKIEEELEEAVTEEMTEEREDAAGRQALHGQGILWAPNHGLNQEEELAELSRFFGYARALLAQQAGAWGTVSRVRAASWGYWRGRLSAEAFLQQVHASGIEDAHLGFYLRAGYLMRGFYGVGDQLEVFMVRAATPR